MAETEYWKSLPVEEKLVLMEAARDSLQAEVTAKRTMIEAQSARLSALQSEKEAAVLAERDWLLALLDESQPECCEQPMHHGFDEPPECCGVPVPRPITLDEIRSAIRARTQPAGGEKA